MQSRVRSHPRVPGGRPATGALALLAAAATALTGCSGLGGSDTTTPPPPPATTGPPRGASQPPGPPLATASPGPSQSLNPRDPTSVAAVCFARWQSFDATRDDPTSGVRRARTCMTRAFYVSLGAGATQPPTAGWLELKNQATRSSVTVLATSPLGPDTRASGRLVLLLNVRRTTTAKGATPAVSVSTPAVTVVRQSTGTWLLAAADVSGAYGQAPGR